MALGTASALADSDLPLALLDSDIGKEFVELAERLQENEEVTEAYAEWVTASRNLASVAGPHVLGPLLTIVAKHLSA